MRTWANVHDLALLEDVVEEIFGEITDETDQSTQDFVRLKGKKWLVAGRVDVDDLNKKLPELGIPESGNYDTFSGFFLEQIERIPAQGESIRINNWIITVKDMDGNRIKSFVVRSADEPLSEPVKAVASSRPPNNPTETTKNETGS